MTPLAVAQSATAGFTDTMKEYLVNSGAITKKTPARTPATGPISRRPNSATASKVRPDMNMTK